MAADAAYWPGEVLVQERDGMVLVSVVGAGHPRQVPGTVLTYVLASA
jgi:hypothetical protein